MAPLPTELTLQAGTGAARAHGDGETQAGVVRMGAGGAAPPHTRGPDPNPACGGQHTCPPATTAFTELPGVALTWGLLRMET